MKKVLALVVLVMLAVATPATAAEINIGGGHPLYGTHTKDDSNHFDGGESWLVYGSIDKEAKSWLSYGLMYNYTRIKMGVETETTKCKFYECATWYDENPGYRRCAVRTDTDHYWLDVNLLGPYVKPHYNLTKRLKIFGQGGIGGMFVNGPVYGDEFGAGYFASAGFTVDIYEGFGLTAQYLYVDGFTNNVEDIDYQAPVLSLKYTF